MEDTEAEKFFQSKNGGQPSYSSDFITATWAVTLMQEYADQQSIEFAGWIRDKKYLPGFDYSIWLSDAETPKRFTDPELLTRFKERQ